MESSQTPQYSTLERLPLEVLDIIVPELPLQDFRSLRLASRTLARAGESHLAQETFIGVPWRDDISRLNSLSAISSCAPRIRSVKLNFARLDEYTAFHESFEHLFLLEPEIRSKRLQEDWAHYFAARPLQETVPFTLPCAVMGAVCSKLVNLKNFCITWAECPWDGEEVKRVFKAEESIKLDLLRAVALQKDLLKALWVSDAPLEELEITPLVVGIDVVTEIFRLRMGTALQSLKSLTMASPSLDVNWGYIVPLLRQMSSLAELTLINSQGEPMKYDVKKMADDGIDISEAMIDFIVTEGD